MGLFGGGNSKKTTVNEDNRTINDYSGADFDQSTNTSTVNESYSDSSSYNEQYSDSSSYNEQYSDSSDNSDRSNNGDFAGSTGDINITDGGAFELMAHASDNNTELLQNMAGMNLSSALSVNENSMMQVQAGNDLALGLAELSTIQQQDNNDALTDGFAASMQFVEDFSRSDGAALAESSSKNMIYMMGLALVGLFMFKKLG